MGTKSLSPLGKELQKHLKRLGWSQRTLASYANITHGTISKLIRGQTKPTPETLNAIGRALGVDPTHLMRLAGIPLPTSKTKRHPSVEYIAQRLDELPPDIQERAVEALGTQLDLICDMYLENQRLLIVISAEKLDRQENSGETEEKSSTS